MISYDETYLYDAQRSLGAMFHHAINTLHIDADDFAWIFSRSDMGRSFMHGRPWVISGMSGVELANRILTDVGRIRTEDVPINPTISITPEYWAGWTIAYFQWSCGIPFDRIFDRVPFSEVISMYHPYHEMDIINSSEEIQRRYDERGEQSRLKTVREARGFSQSELSRKADVSLRSIQLYEQKVNDIDKAQAGTVYRLARALGCDVDTILENPWS